MNIVSSITSLITLAYAAPPAWAAQTTAPPTAHNGDVWLLPLAGLAALLFIGRRQGSSGQARSQHPQRPDATPRQPMPQPPTLPTAAAETRY